MNDHEVPDATDWLSTPLESLAAVDASLRCQVCKDFYKTPMMTSCSHTFCSECIRRVLATEARCPLCRAHEQELRLKSNWALEETVEAFARARTELLTVARNAASGARSPKRKAQEDPSESTTPPDTKRLRTSVRLSKSRAGTPAHPAQEVTGDVEVVDDSENDKDDEYLPQSGWSSKLIV